MADLKDEVISQCFPAWLVEATAESKQGKWQKWQFP